MDEDFNVPRYLDEPERMIIWTVPEFIWISICSMVGLFVKQALGLLIGLLISLLFLRFTNNLKHKYGKQYLTFWCYWNLPPLNRIGHKFPPSYIRKWFI